MQLKRALWGINIVWLVLIGCVQTIASPPAAIVIVPTGKPLRETAVSATPTILAVDNYTASPSSTSVATPTPVMPPTATDAASQLPTFTSIQNEAIVNSALALGVPFAQMDRKNTGIRQYDNHLFFHPIGLDIAPSSIFMLDAGRVLKFDLDTPGLPQTLLSPGDYVGNVRVLEPLDLAAMTDGLLVLDRAGDVYLYDWQTQAWQIDRYDRPVGESSGHYYVAVAGEGNGRYLLETNYHYVRLYGEAVRNRLWPLIESRAVDVAVNGEDVFVLTQEMRGQNGILAKYRDTAYVTAFRPTVDIVQPRQVVVGETAVFVLDMAGQRLLALDRITGQLLQVYQTPPGTTAFDIDEMADRWLFTAPDRLYFFDEPQTQIQIPGGDPLPAALFTESMWQEVLSGLILPIQATDLTRRDFQMPGAPRHYRLGVHQGLDFYWRPGTAVYAVADGVVVRAMHDYEPLTSEQLDQLRVETKTLGFTSSTAIDLYRGRQVWIQHPDGIVSRYIHLSSIVPEIIEGASVVQGQQIGAVGNSGSPASLQSKSVDSHLHFELWWQDTYLGQFFRPVETRQLIETIFQTP
ncbi:MAG: peptidoglycan DD-metalloendopeptidase family protein [Anaerolineales bacterium]|nr:peptidoglycan DD-metalloendopeptidase family protein [Anaerolineales bacterium]